MSRRAAFLYLVAAVVLAGAGYTVYLLTFIDPVVAEAAAIIEGNAYFSERVDWPAAQRRAQRAVALIPSERSNAIAGLLYQLNDRHSHLLSRAEAAREKTGGRQSRAPEPHRVGRHAYIRIGGYSGADRDAAREFATLAQDRIGELARGGACGWVVDLRQNIGGNMWPMLGAVSPLLGEGTFGYFVGKSGTKESWNFTAGAIRVDDQVMYTIAVPVRLAPLPPVAVLTSGTTASSGEAVVIAFRARPDTRSFGLPTGGYSSANQAFPLSDGSLLLVTTSMMADRSGTIYGGALEPDLHVEPVQGDPALAAALAWLDARPICGVD